MWIEFNLADIKLRKETCVSQLFLDFIKKYQIVWPDSFDLWEKKTS